MRKGPPQFPSPRDIAPVMNAVRQYIPMDTPLIYGMRFSLVKHTPNFRLMGVTKEIPWTVDVYRGHFYHVQVEGWSEQLRSIPILISFLRRHLEV